MKSNQTVAVLGLGTMGHGIAQVFATARLTVRCWDEEKSARQSLHKRIRGNLGAFVGAGLVQRRSVKGILERITVCESETEAVSGAHFVTEAVREDLAVKQDLFARLEGAVSAKTILASNSSTFPISASAAKMQRPERAIVTHWFNPPHIVPVVEVVPGARTSAAVTAKTLALMRSIGKEPIHLLQEIPGFVVNRVQIAVMREVWDLLDRGIASPQDIDAAISGTMGFRLAAVGPLEVNDFGGLDIHTRVFENLVPGIQSGTEIPGCIRKLVAGGHFGVKSGRGIYSYSPAEAARRTRRRDRRFLELLKLLHAGGRPTESS